VAKKKKRNAKQAAKKLAKSVFTKIERQGKQYRKGMDRGLKKAGLWLQRASQKIVPIDTGVLRASAFTRAEGHGAGIKVTVGYTAEYAIYVHENLEARHRKGKQAKYLEQPAREGRSEMRKIIRAEVKKAKQKKAPKKGPK
jgi:hypothetical protein